MPRDDSMPHSASEMLDALKTARDRVRVQAHLFSMDARKRWQELEERLANLQTRIEHGGESAAASVGARFHEVLESVKELMGELDGAAAFTTPVRQIMNKDPATCTPEERLTRAAQIMWDRDCGFVPVVDSNGSLVGVITDRDLCMAAYTRGEPLEAMSIASAMSKLVHFCAPDDALAEAARLMADKQVRRLPVVENGRLVGVLALADIARDIRRYDGNKNPACLALAHTVMAILERRPAPSGARAAAA